MKSIALSSANSRNRVFAKSTNTQIRCDSDYWHAHERHEKLPKEVVNYFLATESRNSTGTKSQMIHITTPPPKIFIDFVLYFYVNVLSFNLASFSSV